MIISVGGGGGETSEDSMSLHGAGELPPALTARARSDPILTFQIQGIHLEQNPHKHVIEWPGLEGTLTITCVPFSTGWIHP